MNTPRYDYFELTADHIKLLQRAYVSWEECETGAPAIDCKRPYGNSFVAGDIAEILGVTWEDPRDEGMPPDLEARLLKLHRETQQALEVILHTKSFAPGRYRRRQYHNDWAPEEVLSTLTKASTEYVIGAPWLVQIGDFKVYGRLVAYCDQSCWPPVTPQVTIETPHGTRIDAGVVFARPITDAADLEKLEEYDADALLRKEKV
jgi:hypothetical protein